HALHDIHRSMAYSLIAHGDQLALIRLENDPAVEGDGSVAADRLPIAPAIEHFARQTFPFEAAARHQAYPAVAPRRRPDDDQRRDIEPHDKKGTRADALEDFGQAICKGHDSIL